MRLLEEIPGRKSMAPAVSLKKGDREAGKYPADPYFEPLYAEAEKLDLPICIHTGSGIPDFSPAREFSHGQFMRTKGAAINGVLGLGLAQDPDEVSQAAHSAASKPVPCGRRSWLTI